VSQTPCQHFGQGVCLLVKCKNLHAFANQAFNLKHQIQVTEKQLVNCSCILQQNTRMFIVTEQRAIMYDLLTMNSLGVLPMQEIATCVKAFDKTPDTFYMGVTDSAR